jgi:hypothetical protein
MRWKPIDEAPGYYVSDGGEVRGPRSDILSLQYFRNGYQYVWLHVDRQKVRRRVHRLVAKAFLLTIDGATEVNHLNGLRDDNRVENLAWVSSSQNKIHARDVLGKYNPRPIIGVHVSTGEVVEAPSVNAAALLGFSSQNISACLNGRRNTASNYTWRFK